MIIPRETPGGMVIDVSKVHPAIAAEPFVIISTLIMIKYDVIINLNVIIPIEVMVVGIVMDVNFVQPWNADSPCDVIMMIINVIIIAVDDTNRLNTSSDSNGCN